MTDDIYSPDDGEQRPSDTQHPVEPASTLLMRSKATPSLGITIITNNN